MGNCSLKGVTGECHYSIRVLSDWGSVLHFKGPVTVGEVLQHHPGYGIFRQGHASSALPEQESLSYGLLYYLLPLKPEEVDENTTTGNGDSEQVQGKGFVQRSEEGKMNENKEKLGKSPGAAASENVKNLSDMTGVEVLPSAGNGVWRVKLVIDTRQLGEILSKQVNTEALIEKMRMAASATSSSPATTIRSRRTMSSWKMGWKPTLFNTAIKERLSTRNCLSKSTS